MPNTSLPQLQLPDPNGFVNALGAGMKLRRYRDEGEAAARQEDEAIAQRNALSAYLSGDQSPESRRALGAVSPEAYFAVAKDKRETDKAAATTGKTNIEAEKAQQDVMGRYLGAARSDPSRPNLMGIIEDMESKGMKIGHFRKQVESTPDEALPSLIEGYAIQWNDKLGIDIKAATAESQIKYRDSMLGKPMVVTQPGGTFALSADTGYQPVQLDTGPSQMEADEAKAERTRAAAEATRQQQETLRQQGRVQAQEVKNQQKFRDFQANMKQLTDAANALDADLAKRGTETDIPVVGSQGAAEQSTRYADVMAAIQRIRDMGVLQPGEFPFLEMAVKNPTTWMNALRAGDVRGQLTVIKEQAGQALERAKTRFLTGPSSPPAGGGAATPHADASPDPAKLEPMNHGQLLDELMR